jgi:hypothetical protein
MAMTERSRRRMVGVTLASPEHEAHVRFSAARGRPPGAKRTPGYARPLTGAFGAAVSAGGAGSREGAVVARRYLRASSESATLPNRVDAGGSSRLDVDEDRFPVTPADPSCEPRPT